uniref:Putative secreted protein n=1 Tax=Anopheles darlingi TaxID=43151 RepID=A0A2M4DNM1_ANODA
MGPQVGCFAIHLVTAADVADVLPFAIRRTRALRLAIWAGTGHPPNSLPCRTTNGRIRDDVWNFTHERTSANGRVQTFTTTSATPNAYVHVDRRLTRRLTDEFSSRT